ncbi:hypothetical protein BsWGS_24749 [Bradybaena similaris]
MRAELCCLVAVVLLVPARGYHLSKEKFMRGCYIHNYAFSPTNQPLFGTKDMDLHLCTHFFYAHARIDINGLVIKAEIPKLEEGPKGIYRQLMDIRKAYPSVKFILSLGGPKESNTAFDVITATEARIETFSSRTVNFLYNRSFDGLDIDWQFPNTASRKEKLTRLLKEMRKIFNVAQSAHPMLLTLTASGLVAQVDAGYDVADVALYVDYVLVRAYNLVNTSSSRATFSSPLYPDPGSTLDPTLNVNYSIGYWHRKGLPFYKLVVGFTAVGRFLKLANRSESKPGSPVTREVLYGKHYHLPSGMVYPEICSLMQSKLIQRKFDETQKNPYLVIGDSWVGYEDVDSIATKLAWMMSLGVGGYMFDGVHLDDFTGKFCDKGSYPLLHAMCDKIMDIFTEWSKTTMTTTTDDDGDSQPAKGQESETVLAALGFVFVLAACVTAYGLFVSLTKPMPAGSLAE